MVQALEMVNMSPKLGEMGFSRKNGYTFPKFPFWRKFPFFHKEKHPHNLPQYAVVTRSPRTAVPEKRN